MEDDRVILLNQGAEDDDAAGLELEPAEATFDFAEDGAASKREEDVNKEGDNGAQKEGEPPRRRTSL